MPTDALLRAAAVAAAALVLAAPYHGIIVAALLAAAEAARRHKHAIGRVTAAGLIVAAGWGVIPMPHLPATPAVRIEVETPSPELQRLVEPVRAALAGLPAAERATWAAIWSKAAIVVEAERVAGTPVFPDVPALRTLTTTALEIGWRRIAGHAPGSLEGLRGAVEAAMASAVGTDAVPVTDVVRASYVDVANAIAWAGAER